MSFGAQNVMTPERQSNEIDSVNFATSSAGPPAQSARCARLEWFSWARRIAKHCAGFFNHKDLWSFAAALRALFSRATGSLAVSLPPPRALSGRPPPFPPTIGAIAWISLPVRVNLWLDE